MSVAVIYGSDFGATRAIATRMAARLRGRAVDIKEASVSDFEENGLLILGCPTYGFGDLQSDWEDRIDVLREADLTGKKVAIFGTGDQGTYPDTFVDAIGMLYDEVTARGATVVGFTETDGYDYIASLAERDGKFVGLALDEDQQPELTEARITAWLARLS